MAVTALSVTETPSVGVTELDVCALEINTKYEAIQAAVCSACLTLGLVYCFFGYRCFRMVRFLSGLASASGFVALLFVTEPSLTLRLGLETAAGLALGVGVLCGLTTMLASTLGLLLCGLQLGAVLCLSVLVAAAAHFHAAPPPWFPLAALLASGVSAALLTLRWQKLFAVAHTAVLGAAAVTLCVDYMVGSLALLDQAYDVLSGAVPRPLCWFNWTVGAILPVLAVLGVAVQWTLTARGVTHRDTALKKHRKNAKKYKQKELRRRPPPYRRRRRRTPPLKRYAGDVLAPSYLQSLQERQMETGSSSSSGVSTATHTLIDFDFETGSMVPLTAAAAPVFTL